MSCCELIVAATSSWPQQLLCKRKKEREGERREGKGREESNADRRFNEDSAPGEVMHRMSSAC